MSTDASGTALGYILGQNGPDGKEMVVAYGGRSLRPDEHKCTVTEQECLAVVEGIKAYSQYLTKHFTVVADHQALKWLNSVKDTSSRLGRCALQPQDYDFDIITKQVGYTEMQMLYLEGFMMTQMRKVTTKPNKLALMLQPFRIIVRFRPRYCF